MCSSQNGGLDLGLSLGCFWPASGSVLSSFALGRDLGLTLSCLALGLDLGLHMGSSFFLDPGQDFFLDLGLDMSFFGFAFGSRCGYWVWICMFLWVKM